MRPLYLESDARLPGGVTFGVAEVAERSEVIWTKPFGFATQKLPLSLREPHALAGMREDRNSNCHCEGGPSASLRMEFLRAERP